MKRTVISAIVCFLLLFFFAFVQGAERRTALVIGNADYKSSPLKNPVNDARDMAQVLRELGFSVTMKLNCSQREMTEAIREFGNELTRGGVGLFYYAGHGIQVGGRNYLIPVDADIRAEDEVKFFSVDAGLVLSKMESAGNRTNIVILDACRDNPFKSFKTVSKGLAVVEAPRGSLIVYATAPGSVAAEGKGRNGIFTGALLRHIKTPGVDAELMLREVRRDVMAETGGEQVPWSSSSLMGSFYFAGRGEEVVLKPEEERKPTIVVEKAYGSVVVEVRASGTLYLDGNLEVRIPAGGKARIGDIEVGRHTLEVRYDDGQKETKVVFVEKERSIQVAFSYVERPAVPGGFVLVEAGSFLMGSNEDEDDERPVHMVTISRSFYISKYEVTQREWREVMGTNPSYFKGESLPVESVSWYDVVEYCNRLSIREGLTPAYTISGNNVTWDRSANGYRLPTEAEWEYAARGGNQSRGYTYAGSNSADDVGWYDANSGGKTHPVGHKKPNELGLYDMSGNVWEWCWDWYGGYSSSSQTDPEGPSRGDYRVGRGGGWDNSTRGLPVASRGYSGPTDGNFYLGFRLVRTAE
jgi:formylglycine-generating enzyme required for sulfatase activity